MWKPSNSAMCLAAWLALAAHGEIVDRIAVSVGNSVITTSDVERQVRVSAFLSGKTADLSGTARREMADRMVDQVLIRKELETSRYPVPVMADIEPVYQAFRAKAYPDQATYEKALEAAGLTEDDVRRELLWERAFTQFLEMRFKPAVQVTDAEVQQYFDTVVAPLARQAHPDQTPSPGEYRRDIEAKLGGERANQEMERWLVEARRRSIIAFHDEVFK